MELFFATSNKGKFAEAKAVLSSAVRLRMANLELSEVQSCDASKVAKTKLESAYAKIGAPVIVEDTGLSLDAINGFPGALIKPMVEAIGLEGIMKITSVYGTNRAHVSTSLGFTDGTKTRIITATVNGRIAGGLHGKNGFGFDSIFIPRGSSKTFAEMGIREKNKNSARGRCFRSLSAYLSRR